MKTLNKCPRCKSYWDETNPWRVCMTCGYEAPDYNNPKDSELEDNCEDLT